MRPKKLFQSSICIIAVYSAEKVELLTYHGLYIFWANYNWEIFDGTLHSSFGDQVHLEETCLRIKEFPTGLLQFLLCACTPCFSSVGCFANIFYFWLFISYGGVSHLLQFPSACRWAVCNWAYIFLHIQTSTLPIFSICLVVTHVNLSFDKYERLTQHI